MIRAILSLALLGLVAQTSAFPTFNWGQAGVAEQYEAVPESFDLVNDRFGVAQDADETTEAKITRQPRWLIPPRKSESSTSTSVSKKPDSHKRGMDRLTKRAEQTVGCGTPY